MFFFPPSGSDTINDVFFFSFKQRMMWLKTGTIPNQEKKQNNEEEGKGGDRLQEMRDENGKEQHSRCR